MTPARPADIGYEGVFFAVAGRSRSLSALGTIVLSAAALWIIDVADYWTGMELSFSLFYALPVLAVTWRLGR